MTREQPKKDLLPLNACVMHVHNKTSYISFEIPAKKECLKGLQSAQIFQKTTLVWYVRNTDI